MGTVIEIGRAFKQTWTELLTFVLVTVTEIIRRTRRKV